MSINVEADTNGTDSGGSNQYLGFGEVRAGGAKRSAKRITKS